MQRENMPILAFFGKSFHKYIKLLIIFVITTFHLYASSYGKLRGHVKVYGTNDPLVGVNISIIGSYLGTITDAKGNYTILRIPPGVYDVRYEFIGYTTKTVKDLHIKSDLSTLLDVSLEQSVIEGDEIVVTGERKIIQRDQTTSTVYMDVEKIEKLPVLEARDALMLQAGVFFDPIPVMSSEGRGYAGESGQGEARYTIRGGDQEEIMWLIDGIRTQSLTINRRDAGGSFTNINTMAIKEIQVLSGGFNAEYGNAQSGVVNVIMKEGDEKYNGSFQFSYAPPGQRHFGNYVYDPSTQREFNDHMIGLFYDDSTMTYYQDTAFLYLDTTRNLYIDTKYNNSYDGQIDSTYIGEPYMDPLWMDEYRNSQMIDYRTTPDYNFLGSVGGPLPFFKNKNFSFQLSGQLKQMAYTLPQPRNSRNIENVNLVVSMPITPQVKLKFFGMYAHEIHGFTHFSDWLLQAKYYRGFGGVLDNHTNFTSLSLTHSLNENLFYDLKLSRYAFLFNERPSDYTNTTEPLSDYALTLWGYMRYPDFPNEPFDKYFTIQKTKERASDLSLSGKLNWQINYQFNLKTGFEYNYNTIRQYYDYRFTALSTSSHEFQDRNMHETINPIQFASFVQVKMEFESMIINLGLRHDFFNPNFEWFDEHSTYNPAINTAFDESLDPDGNQIDSLGNIQYAFENILYQNRAPVSSHQMISPRIGASFPINDNTVLHYNYGHYYQLPPISRMRYFKYFRPTPLLEQIIEENKLAKEEGREPEHIPSSGVDHERVIFLNVDELPPQKTHMFEVGLRHNFRNLAYLNLVAYYRDIYNQTEELIGLFDKSWYGWDPFKNKSANVIIDTPLHGDYGDSRGIEVEIRTLFSDRITLDMNYSFSKATHGRASPHKVTFDSTGTPTYAWYDEYSTRGYKSLVIERQFSRPHILRLGLNYNFGKSIKNLLLSGLNVSMMYRYTSGQAFTYLDEDDPPTTYDNHRYPGIHLSDLKIDKTIQLHNNVRFSTFVLISNLFNQKNIKSMGDTSFDPEVIPQFIENGEPKLTDVFGYDMSWAIWYPPRKIEFGLKYEF